MDYTEEEGTEVSHQGREEMDFLRLKLSVESIVPVVN
jgi:hypothetical protein